MRLLDLDFANTTVCLTPAECHMLAHACMAAAAIVGGFEPDEQDLGIDGDAQHNDGLMAAYETLGAALRGFGMASSLLGQVPSNRLDERCGIFSTGDRRPAQSQELAGSIAALAIKIETLVGSVEALKGRVEEALDDDLNAIGASVFTIIRLMGSLIGKEPPSEQEQLSEEAESHLGKYESVFVQLVEAAEERASQDDELEPDDSEIPAAFLVDDEPDPDDETDQGDEIISTLPGGALIRLSRPTLARLADTRSLGPELAGMFEASWALAWALGCASDQEQAARSLAAIQARPRIARRHPDLLALLQLLAA